MHLSAPFIKRPIATVLLTIGIAFMAVATRVVCGGAGASVGTEWPWHRKALSAWANFYVNAILRLHVKDATAGYKPWHAATLRTIDFATVGSNGYAFQVEMNYRTVKHGLRIAEVPIRFEERSHGTSKMSLRVQLESAVMPWKLLFSRRI